jgi:regulator of sigma E protease
MSYLETILLLGVLILIHEAGHFAAARLVGIPVADFSVGFGPRVWSRRWGRTEYALRAFPLGGFVLPDVADPEAFRAFALRKRLVYFLGGPLANLAAALSLFAFLNVSRYGFSVFRLVFAPFAQVAQAAWQVLASLSGVLSRPESLTGAVGIVREGGRAAAAGHSVELALSLSISLAVLNLLPIPVLDGGQILLGTLEELFPRLVRLRAPLTVLGLVLLASVMLYANVHDVVRWLA